MKYSRSYFFKFTLAYVLGSLIIAIITNLILSGNVQLYKTSLLFTIIFFTAYLSGIIGNLFFSYFSMKSQKQIVRRIIPAFILFWFGALIIATVVTNLAMYMWESRDNSNLILEFNISDFLYTLKALAPWIFVISIIFFYVLWRKGINREQKLNEELLKFKYQTLKSQVNPHFLFNSLNALTSLIHSDPNKAETFTTKLSDIYRYILVNENKKLVPLTEEMNFVKDYFDLQKVRDGEKIVFHVEVENTDKYLIIPVSVQVLVENALKHNSATTKEPLIINIKQETEYLKVFNNLQRKTNLQESSGTGLKNLKERVLLITNNDLIIEETNNEFIVKVPIKER